MLRYTTTVDGRPLPSGPLRLTRPRRYNTAACVTAQGYRCTGGGPQGINAEATCVDLEPVVIAGHVEWTGDGPIHRDATNLREAQAPEYMFGSHEVIAQRTAVASGTVSGDELVFADGATGVAALVRGRYHVQLIEAATGR